MKPRKLLESSGRYFVVIVLYGFSKNLLKFCPLTN